MKKSIIISSAVVLAMALCSSCTKDPNYTLESIKEATNEFTFFEEGVSVPVDTTVIFTIKDALGDADYDVTPDGVLAFRDTGIFEAASFTVQKMTINKAETSTEASTSGSGVQVGITIPDAIKGTTISAPYEIKDVSSSVPLTICAAFPEGVTAVKDVEIELPATITISSTTNLIKLKSGYKMSFPKGIVIAMNETSSDYEVKNDNGVYSISLKNDIELSSAKSFKVKLTKLDIQDSWITKTGIDIVSQPIALNGDVIIKAGSVPASASLTVKLGISQSGAKLKSANVKISKTMKLDGQSLGLSLSDSLKKNATVILDNAKLSFNIKNNSPVPYVISGKIRKKGESEAAVTISGINIDANSTQTKYIDCNNTDGLRNFINSMPEKIEIYDLEVKAESSEFTKIEADCTYSAEGSYEVEIPMTFRKPTQFAIDTMIVTKVEMDEAIEIAGLECNFLITNGTEFSFELDAECLIDDVRTPMIATVGDKGVKLGAGETKEVKLSVKADAESLTKVENFYIRVKASVETEKASIKLSDYVTVKLLSLTIPDGVSFNLDKTGK